MNAPTEGFAVSAMLKFMYLYSLENKNLGLHSVITMGLECSYVFLHCYFSNLYQVRILGGVGVSRDTDQAMVTGLGATEETVGIRVIQPWQRGHTMCKRRNVIHYIVEENKSERENITNELHTYISIF